MDDRQIAFTYSRNENGILMRNEDKVLIPEHEPDNVVTKLYLEWLARGNQPPPGDPPRPNMAWTPPEEVIPPHVRWPQGQHPKDHSHEHPHEHPHK
jgi:hypothetical protein